MSNKPITEMSIDELKVVAWDISVAIETLQARRNGLVGMIGEKQKDGEKECPDEVATETPEALEAPQAA